MGLATYLKQWLDDPTTPGERVCFRKPSWMDKQAAVEERQRHNLLETIETQKALGRDLLRQWREEAKADEEERKAKEEAAAAAGTTAVVKAPTAKEVLAEYDQLLLLQAGIADWTYCEPQRDADGEVIFIDGAPVPDRSKKIKVTVENIKALEPATAEWIALTLIGQAQSGFRPVMPEVMRSDDGVIDVRPGVDSDPLGFSSSSTSSSVEQRTNTTEPTDLHRNTYSLVS